MGRSIDEPERRDKAFEAVEIGIEYNESQQQ